MSSIDTHSINSSISSQSTAKTVVSRSLSDSSTASAKSDNAPIIPSNRSLDSSALKQHQQLLKLSFLNSSNSPLKNSSSFVENISSEAKKIAKRFEIAGEISFEDLNNVTQELVNASFDDDLKNLFKVNAIGSQPVPPVTSAAKIAEFQKKLNRIKKEVDCDEVIDLCVDVKEELCSPKVKTEKTDDQPEYAEKGDGDKCSELDAIFTKFKSVLQLGNKDEAKKQLAKMNEMMGSNQEPKNTLTVQPIVRQGTFEIDKTGRKITEPPKPAENDEIMEKIAQLFRTQSMDVRSMGMTDTTGAKIVVVVPSISSTPQKTQPPSAMRHKSAFKASDPRKFTPMKTTTAPTSRLSTLTMPRNTKPTHPYEQKLGGLQSRAGAVRKSLMGSIDKIPQVPKTPMRNSIVSPRPATARRSVSMKASMPQVQVTKSSPMKTTSLRPTTAVAPPRNSVATPRPAMSSTRRLSSVTFLKPATATKTLPTATKTRPSTRASSLFKAPASVRKTPAFDKDSGLV